MAELAGIFYLAAIVAVALGLMSALWIAGLFALGFAALFAFAWATRYGVAGGRRTADVDAAALGALQPPGAG